MMEDDIKRNGSGYYDETPVKAGLFNGPQAGEIWETKMGKEYLILKNHGAFCTVLALQDNENFDAVPVLSRNIKYTSPAMVSYCFNMAWGGDGFIKAMPDDQYLDIMQAVGERLGVTIKVSGVVDANQPLQAEWERERQDMIVRQDKLQAKCKALEAQRDELLDDLEAEHNRLKAAEEKAALYEKMYTALLDRIFARGEAK